MPFKKAFESFAEPPENFLRSSDYLNTLRESSFEDFVRLMQLTFDGKEVLKSVANRTLWSVIINAGDERLEKCERDAGRS